MPTEYPLPSVGAEGTIVRRIGELASGGAHALMFAATGDDSPDSLRATLQQARALAAFYYHHPDHRGPDHPAGLSHGRGRAACS